MSSFDDELVSNVSENQTFEQVSQARVSRRSVPRRRCDGGGSGVGVTRWCGGIAERRAGRSQRRQRQAAFEASRVSRRLRGLGLAPVGGR